MRLKDFDDFPGIGPPQVKDRRLAGGFLPAPIRPVSRIKVNGSAPAMGAEPVGPSDAAPVDPALKGERYLRNSGLDLNDAATPCVKKLPRMRDL
jgi:hypothetical protein